MATNPYYNKVVRGNQTIIDLTADSVTPADVRQGVTFHDLTGAACVGTAQIGKTVASVAPAAVPSEWSSVQASYECVLVDYDNDTAEQRTATVNRGTHYAYSTLDPNEYGIVTCPTVASLADSVTIYAEDPNGNTTFPQFSSPGTTPSASVGGWATAVEMNGNIGVDLGYLFHFAGGTENVIAPLGQIPAGFYTEAATGGVRYVVVCDDGTEVRSTVRPVASSGIVWERCECVGVTGTVSATSPGYQVTYSDATTELFQASSGDVADGSY